jgi:hypothetical protein
MFQKITYLALLAVLMTGCKYLNFSDVSDSGGSAKKISFKLKMPPNSQTITVEDVKIDNVATTNTFEIKTIVYEQPDNNTPLDVRNGGVTLTLPATFNVSLFFPNDKLTCITKEPVKVDQEAEGTCSGDGSSPKPTEVPSKTPSKTPLSEDDIRRDKIEAQAKVDGDEACVLFDFPPTTTADGKAACSCGAISKEAVPYNDFIEVDFFNIEGFKAICGSKS